MSWVTSAASTGATSAMISARLGVPSRRRAVVAACRARDASGGILVDPVSARLISVSIRTGFFTLRRVGAREVLLRPHGEATYVLLFRELRVCPRDDGLRVMVVRENERGVHLHAARRAAGRSPTNRLRRGAG